MATSKDAAVVAKSPSELAAVEPLARPDVVGQPSPISFKINNFDLIRLFAALQVATFHSLLHLDVAKPAFLVPFGWFQGVPIFFVISGFLISGSLDRSPDLKTYARNRILRIYPALWVLMVVTVAVASAAGFSFLSVQAIVWFLVQLPGGFYTPAFLSGFGFGSYNGSLWTIPVELQFYIVLPITYFLLRPLRRTNALLLLVFLAFLALAVWFSVIFPEMYTVRESHAVKLLRYSFVPRFYLFMFGVVLQRFRVHAWPAIRGKGLWWLAGYAAFCLLVPQVGSVYIADEMLMAVTILSLAYTVPTLAERLLRGNDISYGVYLYHGLVINVMIEAGYTRAGWTVPAVIVAAIVLGLLSWRAVERPAIRSKRKAART